MAITITLHDLLHSLAIRRGSSLLEIGEANWYGDIDPASVGLQRVENMFEVVKEFYTQWFAPSRIVAVDINGSEKALRRDLNFPLELDERFDVVINHGTAEHVFNIAQVFVSMHEACEVNGWMIHDAPLTGWLDHGFYCLQPTLFYDLANANCYEVAVVAIHGPRAKTIIRLASRDHVSSVEIPRDALLFVAFRKRVEQPFVLPFQGCYSFSDSGRSALGRR